MISAAAAIAPALTIGLNGRLLLVHRAIELNASPVGSTPTLLSTGSHAVVLERQAVDERLGDRLDGEGAAGVADLVDVAVGGDHGDAEPVRVDLGQFGM